MPVLHTVSAEPSRDPAGNQNECLLFVIMPMAGIPNRMDYSYQLLWQQVAHSLMDDLVRHPSRYLPGMRALGKQYNVSRETVENAFRYLEDLEVITPAQHGIRRQVNIEKLKQVSTLKGMTKPRILFLTSEPSKSPSFPTRHLYESLHELCDWENYILSYAETPSKLSDVRALLTGFNPSGIILQRVPDKIVKLVVSLHIPVVGVGIGDASDLCFPHVSSFNVDVPQLLVRASQQAWDLGRRSSSSPCYNTPEPLYKRLTTVLGKAFSEKGMPFSKSYNLPCFSGKSPTDFYHALHGLFQYTPPTCLILFDLVHYLVASSLFLKQGRRIPDDISIILLSEDPLLEEIFPSPAHFVRYPADMVKQIFLALQSPMAGLQPERRVEIVPIWRPGNSLAAPKHRPANSYR